MGTKTKGADATVELEVTAPEHVLTDAEQRARLDALLDEVTEKHKAERYSLPQLLGEPQPYEPIPGLWFKRPKLGHKIDLLRRHEALSARKTEGSDTDAENAEILGLILPYTFVTAADGSFASPTARQLMYEHFESFDEITEFFGTMLSASRNGKESADPNA